MKRKLSKRKRMKKRQNSKSWKSLERKRRKLPMPQENKN